jgi:hypothetical protein
MFGVATKIIEESMPCRASKDYWRRAMTPRGVAALLLAGLALMIVAGWALELGVHDPAWMVLPIIPFALTVLNVGLDDVIKRGRRELRRSLGLSAERIRELARTISEEIQKAYQDSIDAAAARAAPKPDRDRRRQAAHLPPPHPRLPCLAVAPRLLPVPRARAFHAKGIGRV